MIQIILTIHLQSMQKLDVLNKLNCYSFNGDIMKVVCEYSHMGGSEILEQRYPSEDKEILISK